MKRTTNFLIVTVFILLVVLIYQAMETQQENDFITQNIESSISELQEKVDYNNQKIESIKQDLEEENEVIAENQKVLEENADIIQRLKGLEVDD